jgi:hypothetical protein
LRAGTIRRAAGIDRCLERGFNRAVEPDDLASPHDRLFKQAFGRKESAAAFFQAYLPSEVTRLIQWETLQLAPGSFIDEALRH